MLIAFRDFESPAAAAISIKTSVCAEELKVPRTEEEEYKAALEQKYDLFRDALLAFTVDSPPLRIKVFTADEVKKILDYVMEVYFPQFLLYSYVLSNKQLSDQKYIEVYIDEPLPIPPLSEGLTANPEREEIEIREDEVEGGSERLSDPAASREQPPTKPPEPVAKPAEEVKKEVPIEPPPKKPEAKKVEPVRNLPKLKKETENVINGKVQEFKSVIQEKINAREKDLEKTIQELKAGSGSFKK
jgi:hypothetical protein